MNNRSRFIPILLNANRGLVKTRNFSNPRYIGDPINSIRIFNEKFVDELILLDITRSKNGLGPNYKLAERIANVCFMPFGYGGGIRNINEAKILLSFGIEKLVIQNASFTNPELITQIASTAGSQAVSISLDLESLGNKKYRFYSHKNNSSFQKEVREHLKRVQDAGAGEIILTSVDNEGTFSGLDFNLLNLYRDVVKVPLVLHGGASSLENIKEAINLGADAVAAGSLFVFYGNERGTY